MISSRLEQTARQSLRRPQSRRNRQAGRISSSGTGATRDADAVDRHMGVADESRPRLHRHDDAAVGRHGHGAGEGPPQKITPAIAGIN